MVVSLGSLLSLERLYCLQMGVDWDWVAIVCRLLSIVYVP